MPARGADRSVVYLCLQSTREGQAAHAHVHEIVAGLTDLGWRVRLVQAWRPEIAWPLGALAYWRSRAATLARARREVRSSDLLYVRFHPAALPAVRRARRFGIPVVQELNGPPLELGLVHAWAKPFAPALERWALETLRCADALIAVTPGLADWARLHSGVSRVEVIPNAANADLFRPGPPSTASARSYALFFGSLARWQGVRTLLAAVELPRWPADVDLVFAGDGPERAQVEAAARRNPRVRYVGVVPYRRMPDLVAGSIAGLSVQGNPSGRSDTGLSPLKVWETLACAVPVIVSDYPALGPPVRDRDVGIVVPPDDPPAVAEAVARLRASPEEARRMGQRGRAWVESLHTWKARAAETSRILESVLAERDHVASSTSTQRTAARPSP